MATQSLPKAYARPRRWFPPTNHRERQPDAREGRRRDQARATERFGLRQTIGLEAPRKQAATAIGFGWTALTLWARAHGLGESLR